MLGDGQIVRMTGEFIVERVENSAIMFDGDNRSFDTVVEFGSVGVIVNDIRGEIPGGCTSAVRISAEVDGVTVKGMGWNREKAVAAMRVDYVARIIDGCPF